MKSRLIFLKLAAFIIVAMGITACDKSEENNPFDQYLTNAQMEINSHFSQYSAFDPAIVPALIQNKAWKEYTLAECDSSWNPVYIISHERTVLVAGHRLGMLRFNENVRKRALRTVHSGFSGGRYTVRTNVAIRQADPNASDRKGL